MKTGRHIVWVHPQPEHYFNCMMDALARAGDVKYTAVFLQPNAGKMERPVPREAEAVFLRIVPGWEKGVIAVRGQAHVNWEEDVSGVFKEGVDGVIVSGYNTPTLRGIIQRCGREGIPVAMFSDSNLRSQRGRSWRAWARRRVKKWFLGRYISRVDKLLTANGLGVAYWRYYGVPRGKILRCAYYADYERIEAARGTLREEALGAFGLEGSRKLIVTAARLVPAKGLELMIRAFKEAGLGERGWTYAIAGTGPLERELKELAGEELGKSIRFLGFVQPSGLSGVIRHADLFALPSVYEPHGIVVQESLAAGTPVLASDVCGAAFDLVRNGVNGWVFRSGDQGDLLKKLKEATGDEERLGAMRGPAREVFEEWFERTNPVRVVGDWARGIATRKHAEA